MGTSKVLGDLAFRDFVTDGVSSSGYNPPSKFEIRAFVDDVDARLSSIPGGLTPGGVWNASTNTPALVSSTGTPGAYYIVSVAGTTTLNGVSSWAQGDVALFTSGVWIKTQPLLTKRASDTGSVSIEFFGGVGDGVTDNSAALDAAVTALGTIGGSITFGPGTFKFSAAKTYNFNAGYAPYSIALRGRGQEITQLYWPAGGGLTFNLNNNRHSFHLSDLSFTTGAAGVGVAFSASNSIQLGKITRSDIINCSFLGNDGGAATNYWSTGVYTQGVSGVSYINCVFYGPSAGTAGNGVHVAGVPTGGNKYTIMHQFSICDFLNIGTGILYDSYTQGVTVHQCNFTNGVRGIYLPAGATGSLAELFVTACQFNVFNGHAIDLETACGQVAVSNCQFYINGTLFGICASQNAGLIAHGNSFTYQSAYTTGQYGIYVGTCVGGVPSNISGNTFWGLTTGIYLAAASLNCNVQSNTYFSCTNTVVNAGSLNVVGGGSA